MCSSTVLGMWYELCSVQEEYWVCGTGLAPIGAMDGVYVLGGTDVL